MFNNCLKFCSAVALGFAILTPVAQAAKYGGASSMSIARTPTPSYYSRPAPVPMRPPTTAPFSKTQPFGSKPQWKVVQPAKPDTLKKVGGASPSVTFNRRSIGGASGVNPALRGRAYAALDRKDKETHAKPFQNRGPIILPGKDARGRALEYREHRLKDADHKRRLANGRVTVASEKGADSYKGGAYVSRHHGDKNGKVVRIQ